MPPKAHHVAAEQVDQPPALHRARLDPEHLARPPEPRPGPLGLVEQPEEHDSLGSDLSSPSGSPAGGA
ncbi:MAG TPA: hypothetical protein VFS43_03835 [Polyangiaceae bacterium]|nr:hypothetical protein [Polyangiaceae bacterium]